MDDKSLVQDEGVNAGSASQLAEPEEPSQPQPGDAERVRQGGRPQDAADQPNVNDVDPSSQDGDPELLGSPQEHAAGPGQPSGSAGHDAGSMD